MTKEQKDFIQKISLKLTHWMGTPQAILVHSIFFVSIFFLAFIGFDLNFLLLILTTAVSLEAIYLSLFIQMTVNRQSQSLEDVEENLDDIQEDVQGLEGDVKEIQTDVESLEENVEDISEDFEKLNEDQSEENANQTTGSLHKIDEIEKQLTTITQYLTTLRNDIQQMKKE